MSEQSSWQENNARQLAAALAELRQRLEHYIQEQGGKQEPSPPAAAAPSPQQAAFPALPAPRKRETVSRSFIQQFLGGRHAGAAPAGSPPFVPPAPADASAATPSGAATPITEEVWALSILSELLRLSPFEQKVLLLCAAMELDTRVR